MTTKTSEKAGREFIKFVADRVYFAAQKLSNIKSCADLSGLLGIEPRFRFTKSSMITTWYDTTSTDASPIFAQSVKLTESKLYKRKKK